MKRSTSSGFTLVELLAVIVILSLLVALLLPAIGSAIKSAKNATVSSEINMLAQALADFRSKFGDYPPSRILLIENGDYSDKALGYSGYTWQTPNSTDINNGQLAQRSLSSMRKFFPRLQLGASGAVYTATAFPDFNGNGTMDGPKLLTGDECLVFFLGGMPSVSTSGGVTTWGVTGFGKNPVNPFQSATASTANRVNPLYDFKNDRLLDIDGDGYPSYVDPLVTKKPYIYFSSYSGSGYDPNDMNGDTGSPLIEADEAGTTTPITLTFAVTFPTSGSTATANLARSCSPNPYCATTSVAKPVQWINAQSFQILSAGSDSLYGVGGQYSPQSDNALPVDATNTTPSSDLTIRSREIDNLTSFSTGKLQ
jgi:prepilin-type N-terminal cleavage/methylation domain-containing protein